MACQEFTVLYTHQKTKKSKIWQDGILKAALGVNKAILFDEKGQNLEDIFVKFPIKPGDDLECDRYLITVEGEKVPGSGSSNQPKATERETVRRNNLQSFASSSFYRPVGLKRKYTDFKGPRQMPKKITMEESNAVVSLISESSHSAFPSQFHNSCPLFSVPCKKKENIYHLPPSEDVSMKKTESFPLPASISYANEYKVIQREDYSTNSADDKYLKPEFQVDDEAISSYCEGNIDKAVSQNVRSKAQILALLSKKHKDFSVSPVENTDSVKNLALTSVKLESDQGSQSLFDPSITFRDKTENLLESTKCTIKENTVHSQLLHISERNIQTKSRWDAYLPLCLTGESSSTDEAEHQNVSDLQPILKENSIVRSKNQGISPQLSSLETTVSPISKCFIKNQQCSFISTEPIKNEMNVTEVASGDHINSIDCINASRILENELTNSSKLPMADNLARFGNESQNEPFPIGSARRFSNDSACGDLGDPNKEFTEVNFNLLETVDFSDSEGEEFHVNTMLSGDSKSVEDTEIQLDSTQKNLSAKTCSIGRKDNVQPAFQQDRDVNYISGFQPLQLCDKISEKPNNMKENDAVLPFVKEVKNLDASVVDEMRDTKASVFPNICGHRGAVCNFEDCLKEDISCELSQTAHLTKKSTIPHLSATSSICFMNKNNEKDVEIKENSAQPSSRCISDNMKSVNPSLAFTSSSDDVSQYFSQEHYSAPEENHESHIRLITYSLNCQNSNNSHMSKNELVEPIGIDFLNKSDENKENFVCNKSSVNSLNHSSLTNCFRLLNSLTEHNSALESLQTIEESTDIFLENEKRRKNLESVGPEGY